MNLVNTKHRKHHRPSSDGPIVIHQYLMSKQTQLSELIQMNLPSLSALNS